jgi:hypothetical protein
MIAILGGDLTKCRSGVAKAIADRKPVEGAYEVDDFHARQFIRAIFAYLEGTSFAIKAWPVDRLSVAKKITLEERWVANETAFELRNGSVAEKMAKIRLDENIAFAFALLDRLHGMGPTLDKSQKWWSSLQSSIKVRHRLTHPRRTEDLHVLPSELFEAMDAEQGFTELMLAYPDLKDAP